MNERILMFQGEIGCTELDLELGLEAAKKDLENYRIDLANPDEKIKKLAVQVIPQFENAIQHGEQLKPDEMMTELVQIFSRAHNLEEALLKPEEIGRRMGRQFGDQINCYRVILSKSPDWIKSLSQLVAIADKTS